MAIANKTGDTEITVPLVRSLALHCRLLRPAWVSIGLWRDDGATTDRGSNDAGPDKRSYRVSFERIRRLLPTFRPLWDARMGPEQLYQAHRSSGLTLEDSEGTRYQRIGHIKKLLADKVLDFATGRGGNLECIA
jgi:hypothetical protein